MLKDQLSTLGLLSLCVSTHALCEMTIKNLMNHRYLGGIDAHVTAATANTNKWKVKPADVLIAGEETTYSVRHRFLGTGHLNMNVHYDLRPQGQTKTYANIEVFTNCDERGFKMEVYIKNCKVMDGPPSFCYDIGFANTTCTENGAINNEHYSASLVANGTGYQHNDYLCSGNAFSEQRFNPIHCLKEFHFEEKIKNLEAEYNNATELLVDVTTSISADHKASKDLKRQIVLLSEETLLSRTSISNMKKQLEENPKDFFLKAKILEEENKLEMDLQDMARLKALRWETSVNFENKYNLMLETKENVKNSAQSLTNLNSFLSSNYCSGQKELLELLLDKVDGTVDSIETFSARHECSMVYFSTEMAGMILDKALALVPGVGGAIVALQMNPNCQHFGVSSLVPTTKMQYTYLIRKITSTVCHLDQLPSPVYDWLQQHICGVRDLSWFYELSLEMLCGNLGTSIIEVFALPALCPLTLGGRACNEALGDSVCTIKNFANKTIPLAPPTL